MCQAWLWMDGAYLTGAGGSSPQAACWAATSCHSPTAMVLPCAASCGSVLGPRRMHHVRMYGGELYDRNVTRF